MLYRMSSGRYQMNKFTQTVATVVCKRCVELEERNRVLRNQVIDWKQKLARERSIVVDLRSSKWFQN